MVTIENNYLKASFQAKGAELQQLYGKEEKFNYIWKGDPALWEKHAPVLFPIVGTLKNDTYYFKEKEYHLGRHGFARDTIFSVSGESPESVTFVLTDSEHTHAIFPFPFRLEIRYQLNDHRFNTRYRVINTGTEDMYFSIGGHPAFQLPLPGGGRYDDHYLFFDKVEKAERWPISKDGLIEKAAVMLLDDMNRLPLSKSLFYNDAIVFKHLRSSRVDLRSNKATTGFSFDFTGFPYLGIWAAKNADFVCIEPWCGIADAVDADQQLPDKEGIETLFPGQVFDRTWSVTLL